MLCMKSELDLFADRPVQASILKTEEVSYKPIASLDNTTVIEFTPIAHGDTYRDLSSIYLRLQVKLLKDNQDTIHTDAKSGVCNNILHSLIRQCSVYLNGKPVAQTESNYNYRSYIENLLNYGVESAQTHLEGTGWIIDKGNIDSIVDKENPGLDARKKLFGKSGTVELIGKLHADMFNQSKLLLSNVDLRIVLSLEKPEFYVMEEDGGKSYVKITDATLYMNHCTISPSILLAHEKVLQTKNCIYPYKRVEVLSHTIPANSKTLHLDNVVTGRLPNFLVFGMVDNEAFVGKRSKNPYNFQHYNISEFCLSVNGVQVPSQPLQFDFQKSPSISTHGYYTLFKGTNIQHFDRSHQITKQFFENGCFLLAFDLTADQSNDLSACGNLLNQGVLRIHGRFSNELPKTISCIIYLEYSGLIEIDKTRTVYTRY